MTRQINDAGLNLIKGFETLQLSAMMPTPNDVPTIGYGHTKGVGMGDTCTEDQALEWLIEDLAWAEEAVCTHATGALTDNQYAALVSICFNIGGPNFDSSTLLRDLNAGDVTDAAHQFEVWDKQRGVTLPGLERRREA